MKKYEKDINRYIRNATNRTITKCAKIQRELIKQEYDLPNKKIRNVTRIYRANQHKLQASIFNTKVKLSINNFKRFQNKQGVRVKINKDKSLFFKGAFLGLKKGQNKKEAKRNSGFMALKNPRFANGFETKKAVIISHKNYANSPREHSIYYLKTKDFSLIAKDNSKALQKQAIEIFREELAKE